jgi:hypothetical protein
MGDSMRRVVTLTLALLALACSKDAAPPLETAAGDPAGAGSRPARVLELPEAAATTRPTPNAAAAPAGMAWDLPAGWTEVPTTSSMRRAQYRVQGPAGDAECIVYYFGPGQGGDAASNAARWAGQFRQPDGGDPVAAMRMTALDGTQLPVQIVEVAGTYDGGMTMTDAPAESLAGYMLLGGIAEGPDAPWFFKFTGPEGTVRAQRDAFIAMMRSLRLGS